MHHLTVKAAKKAVTPINHFEDLNLRKHGGELESLHEGECFCLEANILPYEVITNTEQLMAWSSGNDTSAGLFRDD